jgi:hypothetical protein
MRLGPVQRSGAIILYFTVFRAAHLQLVQPAAGEQGRVLQGLPLPHLHTSISCVLEGYSVVLPGSSRSKLIMWHQH